MVDNRTGRKGTGNHRSNPNSSRGSQKPSVESLGAVRRSQVISTYSIGSVVDLENGSFMPLGLEDWEAQASGARQTPNIIYEPRLQAQLEVEYFRAPPILERVFDKQRAGLVDARYAVPATRFPRWHECPKCHRLGEEDRPFTLDDTGTRLICTKCKTSANPVRFVVACNHGHINDFPWEWWAHRKNPSDARCDRPVLFLESFGESSSLADLYVRCDTCKAPGVSLGDAFMRDAISSECLGRRPWLMDREPCTERPRTLQRGASNLHFPVMASALSIPPASEAVFIALDEHWSIYRQLPADALDHILKGVADNLGVPVEVVLAAYGQRKVLESSNADSTELSSRSEEYVALSTSQDGEVVGEFIPYFENFVFTPSPELQPWFELIGAVSRLREVRAMVAFTRIEPLLVGLDHALEAFAESPMSPLSKVAKNWLPAAEIRGEGIFLRFSGEKIRDWIAANPEVQKRADAIDGIAERRANEKGHRREYRVTPRVLLLHSFAHALIRQLSIDCGYSSSALRERLYIAEPEDGSSEMNGVLIYTGSPDSEGSLGGLVSLADRNRITDLIKNTLKAMQWCGSDPVCIETDPDQSGERISGPACHCCLLVPETACEKFNRELDRSMLIGAHDGTYAGYFSDISML